MLAFLFYALFHGTVWQICVGGALLGVGIGFSFASMANLVVESVPRDEVGVATGINTIMRSLGGALGAQLVASLLTGKTIAGHRGSPPRRPTPTRSSSPRSPPAWRWSRRWRSRSGAARSRSRSPRRPCLGTA